MGKPEAATEYMRLPCKCPECGLWYDHHEGQRCIFCHKYFCPDCVENFLDSCETCDKKHFPNLRKN